MTATAPAISLDALLDEAANITDARLVEVVLRKSDPTWRFALAANASAPGFVLALTDGAVTGYGSASEITHLGYAVDDMRRRIDAAMPALRGGRDRTALTELVGPARAIVHTALLDLIARRRGEPVHALLGARLRTSVAVTRILSLKSPHEMAAIARQHQHDGYRHVKIKLDNDGDLDAQRVAAIRAAVGPHFGLTVDANQSYSPEQAVRLCERLAELDVLVFEQPVPADDLDALAYVTARSPVRIEADEAASSLERVRMIADRGAAHGVSIKIPKLGGVDHVLAAAGICRSAGLDVRLGAHVGSRVLNAAAAHVAAVLPNLDEPAELAEFERLEGDPATGLTVTDGVIAVPHGPGLGVDVSL